MGLLKNKLIAVLLTALVTFSSTIYSVNHFLGAECRAVEDGFYEGVYVDGYRQPGIGTHLDSRLNAANGLMTVTSDYPQLEKETESVRDCRERLIVADDMHAKHRVNTELQTAVKALEAALGGVSLSEQENAMFESYITDFYGAQTAIENSGYNEAVREFNRNTYYAFPAGFLAPLSGVESPELFE
jgi:hypothetical protein